MAGSPRAASPRSASPRKASPKGKKARTQPFSNSARAGLQFPVGRIRRYMRNSEALRHATRLGHGAPVYMSAIMEYMLAELLELAGNAAKAMKKTRLAPRHIQLALQGDEEFRSLFRDVTVPSGGVFPHIPSELLPPQSKAAKDAKAKAPTVYVSERRPASPKQKAGPGKAQNYGLTAKQMAKLHPKMKWTTKEVDGVKIRSGHAASPPVNRKLNLSPADDDTEDEDIGSLSPLASALKKAGSPKASSPKKGVSFAEDHAGPSVSGQKRARSNTPSLARALKQLEAVNEDGAKAALAFGATKRQRTPSKR